jgi:hypothetical protein
LKWAVVIGVLLAVLWASAHSNAVADDTTIVKGQCSPESHIAEGAIGEDLTKRQSRFFCDAAVITLFSDNSKHIMIQFAESKSSHLRQIGYAGMMEDTEIMNVASISNPARPRQSRRATASSSSRRRSSRVFLVEQRSTRLVAEQ